MAAKTFHSNKNYRTAELPKDYKLERSFGSFCALKHNKRRIIIGWDVKCQLWNKNRGCSSNFVRAWKKYITRGESFLQRRVFVMFLSREQTLWVLKKLYDFFEQEIFVVGGDFKKIFKQMWFFDSNFWVKVNFCEF